MNKKLFLFDCDGTLWESSDDDYISSCDSDLTKIDDDTIKRNRDSKHFYLRDGIREAFELVSEKDGVIAGLVSDNKKEPVISALKFLGLWQFVEPKAINIKPWKGYCPKHKMVLNVLKKEKFNKILRKDVYWFDDKDYSREANKIRVRFVRVGKKSNLFELVRGVID